MDPLHPARECRSLQTAPHPALQQTEISEFLRTKKPHRPRAGPRELPAARWYEVICSCLGCELSQVVNAESLFNLGDAIDNFEESIFTKEFVFLFSKSSPSESNSCALTIPRKAGHKMVSSRASCGLYMRMNWRIESTSFRRSSAFLSAWFVARCIVMSVSRRSAWCCCKSTSTRSTNLFASLKRGKRKFSSSFS